MSNNNDTDESNNYRIPEYQLNYSYTSCLPERTKQEERDSIRALRLIGFAKGLRRTPKITEIPCFAINRFLVKLWIIAAIIGVLMIPVIAIWQAMGSPGG